ncbi:SDR family oxidoreductase [uncultured Sphingomonas sp.]|uniref:SDR family oxidoreductase n=1 Tax=uncultured Sphingomonas sp. TaxID=158754 RepID=UPI0025EBB077|nr:SDR family oxidoreductase [uncultured Sphingomonas sp.]
MDLGIAGRKAIVCASSAGLGRACALELARAGVDVVVNGRDAAKLAETAAAIRAETGVTVTEVVGDLSTEEGRAALLAACPDPDILVNNNGGPPLKPYTALEADGIRAGIEANFVTPALLIQAVLPGMVERGFGRVVNITSGSVKMPLPGLDLSSGARAGLTGFVAGIARQVAGANVTINGLLPGSFDTARIASMTEAAAKKNGTTPAEEKAKRAESIPAKRIGDPAEFGAACAFLCSDKAGFITGQSLLIDGGAFPGIL